MKALRTRNLLISAALTAFLSGFTTARAADLLWDNGADDMQWNTTSANWSGSTWNNATPDSAIFGATGIGTVSLTTGITASSITFNSPGFTIAGGTLTLGGPTPGITNNADASISSVLAGSAGLTKAGSGNLTLSGANTYTGNTTNLQASVVFGNVSAFGSSGTVVIGGGSGNVSVLQSVGGFMARPVVVNPQSGGTVRMGSLSTYNGGGTTRGFTGAVTLNGNVTLQGCADSIGNRTDIDGNIAGIGNVTIDDPTSSGRSVLFAGTSQNNTWNGALTINAGARLQLGQGAAIVNGIPDTSAVTVNGTLSVARNGNEAIDGLNGSATGSITRNATSDGLTVGSANGSGNFGGVISGALTTVMLTKTGTGTQTLSGINTYAGSTTISGGTLTIGGAGQLGGGSYAGALVDNGTFIYNSSANQILSGVISGNGIITNAGPGKLTISSASTFTGAITVNDGAALGVTVSGSSQLPPATLTEGSSAGPTTNEFTGVFNPSVAPVKAGTLALNGSTTVNILSGNFFPGQIYPLISYTTINGTGNFAMGTLPAGVSATVVTNGSSIALNVTAAPPAYVWAGNVNGTWDINTTANWKSNGISVTYLNAALPVLFDDTASTFTVNNAAVVSPGGFGTLINNTTNAYTIGGSAIAGANGLVKSGTNMLTLSGANTYTGPTTISAGAVTIPTGGAIAGGSAISVGGSGTLGYTALGTTIGNAISGTGVLNLTPSDSSVVRTFVFTGNNNSFAGTLNYNVGAFANYTAATSLPGSASAINVVSGGQVLVNNGLNFAGRMSLAGYGVAGATAPGGNNRGALALFQCTISGPVALTGNASIAAGNAGTASTISGNLDLAGNTVTFTNGTTVSGAITVTGAITNTGSVMTAAGSSGAFTLTLSSAANNYTGDTTVSSGTLTLGANEVIPNGSGKGNVTVNGTLNVNGKTETINGLSGSGAINGTGTLTAGDNNATSTFGGVISSALALAKTGSGTVTLTGVNTYSGTTTVNAGKLVVSAAQTGTGAVSVSDNATLGVTASGASRLSPTSLTVGSSTGATLEFSLTSTTVAPLTPVAFTFNGTPKINIASCPATAGSYPLASNFTASVPTLNSQPVNYAGSLSVSGNVLYYNLSGVAVDYWTAAVNGNWDMATANWTNNLPGNLYVDGAPVQFDDSASGASPLAVSVTAGGVSPGAIVVSNSAKDYVIGGGSISGNARLTKLGSGTLTMTNVNTYAGGTTISNGAVSFGNGGLGTAGTVAVAGNATLQWNGANTQDLSPRLTIANGATATLDTMANTVAFGTAFGGGGSGGLTKLGTGTLTLSGANGVNTYTGPTVVSNGVLTVNDWLGTTGNPGSYSGAVMVASGATLNLSAAYALYEFLSGPISGSGTINATPNAGGGYRFSGDGTAFTGALNANVASGNLFAGSTTVLNAAVNVVGNSGVFGFTALSGTTAQLGSLSGSGIVGADAGTCTFQVGNLNTDTTFSGVIKDNATTGGGVASLIKVGTGTLTLSGASTYSGATTVNNGTLQVNGTLAAGTAAAVNGGTLRGVGTINRAVNVNSGGTLAAGTNGAVGTLTIGGALTLSSGSTTHLRITKTGGTTTNDVVKTTGLLTYGGTLVVTNITGDGNTLVLGDTFTLFNPASHNGTIAAPAANLPQLPGGYSWDISQLVSSGKITVANVAATPTFSLAPGAYIGAQPVTVNCTTPGVTIYYTTNNTTPNTSSASGASGLTVTVPLGTTMTLQAYAGGGGFADSAVASATFTTVSTPSVPTWVNAAGGSWPAAGNWSNNVVASQSGDTADFSQLALSADTTVTLDGARTVGNLAFDDQSPTKHVWTLATGGGDPLTLAVASGAPMISNNAPATIGVVLAGTQGLTKTGNGTLVLTNDNLYTGPTTIAGGTLQVGTGGAFGSLATSAMTNNGALVFNRSDLVSLTAPITGTGLLTANAGAGTVNISGAVSLGSVSLTAGNTIRLQTDIVTTGNQAYSGRLSLGQGSAADITTLTTTAGGTVSLGGAFNNAANYGSSGALNIDTSAGNGNVFLAGASPVPNLGNLNLHSGSGTITLSGGNYGTADYTLFDGSVSLAGDSILTRGSAWARGATFRGDVSGAFTLTGNFGSGGALSSGTGINGLVFDTATTSTVSSILAGTTGLTKTGAGVTTLAAANSYTGGTLISNGVLRVDGSLASGSSVTVAPNGTLSGTGTVNGTVAVDGTLSPGASIGTLTLANNVTLNATATTTIELDKSAGQTSDKILGMGTFNRNGVLQINNNGPALVAGDTFAVFGATIFAGAFASISPAHPDNNPALLWDTSALNTGTLGVHRPPVASAFGMGTALGGTGSVTVVDGKYVSTTDADGDSLIISGVTQGTYGTVSFDGTSLTYSNITVNATDSFTYTISDGRGGTSTATVTVTTYAAEGFNKLSGPTGTGPYSLSYLGIPGHNYALDESPNLIAPYTWYPVVTNTASGTGAIEYNGVTLTYPSGSFRTRHVP